MLSHFGGDDPAGGVRPAQLVAAVRAHHATADEAACLA